MIIKEDWYLNNFAKPQLQRNNQITDTSGQENIILGDKYTLDNFEFEIKKFVMYGNNIINLLTEAYNTGYKRHQYITDTITGKIDEETLKQSDTLEQYIEKQIKLLSRL